MQNDRLDGSPLVCMCDECALLNEQGSTSVFLLSYSFRNATVKIENRFMGLNLSLFQGLS